MNHYITLEKSVSTVKYIFEVHVINPGKDTFEKETSEEVVTQWEKMSKSKYNGVDPQVKFTEAPYAGKIYSRVRFWECPV